jgi:uncharacterized protein YnzC (UPF0291/DUF896 family)
MDYNKRLTQLEEKLEREGLTENEKAEIALVRSKALRECKRSIDESLVKLNEGLRALEELRKFS